MRADKVATTTAHSLAWYCEAIADRVIAQIGRKEFALTTALADGHGAHTYHRIHSYHKIHTSQDP